MTTLSEMIVDVENALSQVSGTSVQVYAEDRISLYIQRAFNLVWDEVWWDDYMQWFERSLDGSQGIVTQNINDIKRWEDIRAVFAENKERPLRGLPSTLNPFNLSGSTPRFISRHGDDNKMVQFWPKGADGKVYIHARVKPDDFAPNDDIRIDHDLILYGATWLYAEDDGTNPGAIDKNKMLFEQRLQQLKRERNNQPIELDERSASIPTEWEEHW